MTLQRATFARAPDSQAEATGAGSGSPSSTGDGLDRFSSLFVRFRTDCPTTDVRRIEGFSRRRVELWMVVRSAPSMPPCFSVSMPATTRYSEPAGCGRGEGGADQSSARRPSMRGGSGVLQTPRGSVRMLLVSPCGCSARKHQGSRQDTQVQSATVQPVSSHRKLHRNRAEEEQAQPAGSDRPEHKGREAQRYARCPGRIWCRAAR